MHEEQYNIIEMEGWNHKIFPWANRQDYPVLVPYRRAQSIVFFNSIRALDDHI